MAKKTGKKTGKLDLFPIINGIIMVLFIVITLYPVLNTLAISLNDGTDALRGGITQLEWIQKPGIFNTGRFIIHIDRIR